MSTMLWALHWRLNRVVYAVGPTLEVESCRLYEVDQVALYIYTAFDAPCQIHCNVVRAHIE